MKININKLKRLVDLNNNIIGSRNLRKAGPLSNLIFIVKDSQYYTLAQGSKNITNIALFVKGGQTDAPDGVYAIDGVRFGKVISELVTVPDLEDPDLIFVNDGPQQVVGLQTALGGMKFTSYRIEPGAPETRFDDLLPYYQGLMDQVQNQGHEVSKEQWLNDLSVVSVAREEEFVMSPFFLDQTVVGIYLPQFVYRRKTEYPYRFATEMDMARVLRSVVDQGEEMTHSFIQAQGNKQQFILATTDTLIVINGVNTDEVQAVRHKWDQEAQWTGVTSTEDLKRLLRIAKVFVSDNSLTGVNFNYPEQELEIVTEGVDLANQQGVNTHVPFVHQGDNPDCIRGIVDGDTFLNLLNDVPDDTVSIELIMDRKNVHVVFEGGDFYFFFRPL